MEDKTNGYRQVKLKNLFDERMVIEGSEEYEKSVYTPIYQKAKYLLEGFKKNFKDKNEKANRYAKNSEYRQEDLQVVNTISFEGRRGTGKTSAMMSYCNHLREDEEKYIVLDYIDASALEEGENVLEIVLANMYNELTRRMAKKSLEYESRIIIREFEKIYSSIKFINERRDKTAGRVDLSPLSGLERLSNSQQLKKEVYKLICLFGKFIASEEAILIVPIDDVDMCFHSDQSSVYEVMETLHRYLMIPNVVIFMTYDYPEILSGCVKHFSHMFYGESFYGESFSKDKQYGHYKQHIRDVANRYLEKILPTYARIHLPSQRKRDYMDQNNIKVCVEQDDIDKNLKEFKEYLMAENNLRNNGCSSISLNPKRFALLFKASNFGLFYDSRGKKRHYAEPSDFRDMVHIVTMCDQLRDDYVKDTDEADEFVFKELLDDLYFRFARVELSPNEEEYDQFNEYLKVGIERRSKDILNDIWVGLREKLGDERYQNFCSKIEYNYRYKHKVEVEYSLYGSYSYGELLYGLYRASSNKVLNKGLIWCILDSYTIMLTKLHRSIKRKKELSLEALIKDESYKIIKDIIGPSISSSWSNYYIPRMTDSESPVSGISDAGRPKLGAIKYKDTAVSVKKHKCLKWSFRPISEEAPQDVLRTIEILCMFFTEVTSTVESENRINKYFSIKYYSGGDDDVRAAARNGREVTETFEFAFDGFCFNILNFVVNLYFGDEYFYNLHEALKDEMRKYLIHAGVNQDIDKWIDENSLNKRGELCSSGMKYNYKSWKEKYGACAMPIYSFDMMYNILKRIYLDILDSNPGIYNEVVSPGEFVARLMDVYKRIGDALAEQDEYYYPCSNDVETLKDKKSFKKAFNECPFIQYMGNTSNNRNNLKGYLIQFFNDISGIVDDSKY